MELDERLSRLEEVVATLLELDVLHKVALSPHQRSQLAVLRDWVAEYRAS